MRLGSQIEAKNTPLQETGEGWAKYLCHAQVQRTQPLIRYFWRGAAAEIQHIFGFYRPVFKGKFSSA